MPAGRALLIGGSGPTGPFILGGLAERGYEPVILHRGVHELESLRDFEHLHADPYSADSVGAALAGRSFDLVVATYGRLSLVVDQLAGHTDRLITVGGTGYERQRWSGRAGESARRAVSHPFLAKVQQTEDAIMARHADGTFRVTHLRYPNLFGPRQPAPREWSVIRRILDGRRTIPVIHNGLTLESRAYIENAAHAVLLAVDQPGRSAGRIYHVADATTPSDAERVRAIATAMGAGIEPVDYAGGAGLLGRFWTTGRNLDWMGVSGLPPGQHKLLDSSLIRSDLGYAELIDFETAVARTVDYLLRNPLERGGREERRIGDAFDYAAEDKYQRELAAFLQRCDEVPVSVAAPPRLHDGD